MKRLLSLILAVTMTFSMSVVAFAAESEDLELRALEQSLKENAFATITDDIGNVKEVLDVDVDIQKRANARNANGIEYVITYTTRAYHYNTDHDSKDGVTATCTITSNDVVGFDNILVSAIGGWSDDGIHDAESSTHDRKVTLSAYSFDGTLLNSLTEKRENDVEKVGTSFTYTPHDFIGYTFTLSTQATITATGTTINLYATTEGNG